MEGKYQKLVGGGWAVRVVWLACMVRLVRVDRAVRLASRLEGTAPLSYIKPKKKPRNPYRNR